MGQYRALRSFAISLAIVIAVTNTTQGFVIRRVHNTLEKTHDLDAGGSSLVAVTKDVDSTKQNEINMTIDKINTTVIALTIPKKSNSTDDAQNENLATKYVDIKTVTGSLEAETLISGSLQVTSNTSLSPTTVETTNTNASNETENVYPTLFTTLEISTLENNMGKMSENKNTQNTLTPNTTETETLKYYFQSITENIKNASKTITDNMNNVSKTITENFKNVSQSIKENLEKVSYSKNVDHKHVSQTVKAISIPLTKTEDIKIQYQNREGDIENITNKITVYKEPREVGNYSKDESVSKSKSHLLKENIEKKENGDTYYGTMISPSYVAKETREGASGPVSSTVLVTATSDIMKVTPNLNIVPGTFTSDQNKSVAVIDEIPIHNIDLSSQKFDPEAKHAVISETTDFYQTVTEFVDTVTISEHLLPNKLEKLSTYTERKTPIKKEVRDMVNAESAQITVNKSSYNTGIPKGYQKNAFNNDSFLESINATEGRFAEFVVSTGTSELIDKKTDRTKIESSRAGFIDNTNMSPMEAIATTVDDIGLDLIETVTVATIYDTEDSKSDDIRNTTEAGLEIKMDEDAIKEALLREEIRNDNQENAERVQDGKANARNDTSPSADAFLEDKLSVKPLGPDGKRKPSDIYLPVNYKPRKKIDVQPSKQLIRDPDDNSWRNESISSLGIVFKPKNASKSFKEVLKNKTESELSNILEKDYRNKVPDLKVRLEKITEERKKKKKINMFGDASQSDYEDSSEEIFNSSTTSTPTAETSTMSFTKYLENIGDTTVTVDDKNKYDIFHTDFRIEEHTSPASPGKKKKVDHLDDYDEYEADYLGMSKFDIKKFIQTPKTKYTLATRPPEHMYTTQTVEAVPDRQPTVQYFPPTTKFTRFPPMPFNYYGNDSKNKNLYTTTDFPRDTVSSTDKLLKHSMNASKVIVEPRITPVTITPEFNIKSSTNKPPAITSEPIDHNFNKASYVIKHYRDFINEALSDFDIDRDYTYKETPLRGLTTESYKAAKNGKIENEDHYDDMFRKNIMSKFIDNFNQNSERFKVDFPVIYNNSIVHRQEENGKVASSSAFMKRLYEVVNPKPSYFLSNVKPCGLSCENVTLELSPAYELHYYVPEQEEKEEFDPHPYNQRFR